MRYLIPTIFILLAMLGTSMPQEQRDVDAKGMPQLCASAVLMADESDGHLFALHRERPDNWSSKLRYSLMRYPVRGGEIAPHPTRIWFRDVSDPLDQPGMRVMLGSDIDISADNDAVVVVIARSNYPMTWTEVYSIDPDAPQCDIPDPEKIREAVRRGEFKVALDYEDPALIAKHTLRNVEATCGVDRVRLMAGRDELRIFLTRSEEECGEEEIRYNLDTGQWTPESWKPSAPPKQVE